MAVAWNSLSLNRESVIAELISENKEMFDSLSTSKFRYKCEEIRYRDLCANRFKNIPSILIDHSGYEIEFSLNIGFNSNQNCVITLKLLQLAHINDIEIYARCKANIGGSKHLCINKKWKTKELNLSSKKESVEVAVSQIFNNFTNKYMKLVLNVEVIKKEKPSIFKVSDDLDALFKSADKSDITFTFDNKKEIKAHQLILTTRNQAFAKMLKKDVFLEDNKTIKIEHIDSDIFEILLYFIYTGKEPITNDNKVGELLIAAETYDVDELINICESKIIKNLNIDNAAEKLIIADNAKSENLKAIITNFIYNNKQVLNTVGYKNMEETHSRLVRNLIRKFNILSDFKC